jgi:hypothetical protein
MCLPPIVPLVSLKIHMARGDVFHVDIPIHVSYYHISTHSSVI